MTAISVSGMPYQRKEHYLAEIDTKWADLLLLACFFCSGLIDSMAFNMYGCFVSMQTGNTIFLGLGVTHQPTTSPPLSWSKSLIAILSFALGALFFSTFHRTYGPQRRWVLVANFTLQSLLTAIVALVTTTGRIPNRPPATTLTHSVSPTGEDLVTYTLPATFPSSDYAPIAILAFQSAGQIVASRVLKFNAMPTVVLTSLYCDLMSDARLFSAALGANGDRSRRLGGAVLLLGGAICGALLGGSRVGFMGGLWIGCVIKGGMAGAWVVWREKGV
ncbi:hypothetical protein T440DRAFT_512271 [Plenodomus tracheiphilus IPT5]|uniref:DUF1275 domain protein n=1 Tax=Plenodomus tracheiphilus IPT5 TaxID=1408161 RepID=A0A6A7AQ58_9PLEO|nr:hypothetical protein T440DRAFT_512271 [Plenodomus tracheiphilus IPT5]